MEGIISFGYLSFAIVVNLYHTVVMLLESVGPQGRGNLLLWHMSWCGYVGVCELYT